MTRLVLLTCIWKRFALAELVLRAYRRIQRELSDRLELHLLAVGSDGERARALCERHGFDYLEHANEPLNRKWNEGVRRAHDFAPDGLCLVGSDDLVSARLLLVYAEKLRQGFDFFGLADLFFFDPVRGQLGYWEGYGRSQPKRAGEPSGCARCFSRRLLDRAGWLLWPGEPGLMSGLDIASARHVASMGFEAVSWKLDELGVRAVDIKVRPGITRFDRIPCRYRLTGQPATDYLREWLTEDEIAGLAATGGPASVA